jgi:methenyltetrahydromethanopterin cyclohydrolase
MRYQAFVRAAAGVLATALFGAAAALAQTQPQPDVMTDAAPLPATERSSLGAVIMMDQPVLAQRSALRAAQERTAVDTRTMGAGPARIMRDARTRDEVEMQRALDEALRQDQGTPK